MPITDRAIQTVIKLPRQRTSIESNIRPNLITTNSVIIAILITHVGNIQTNLIKRPTHKYDAYVLLSFK